MKLHWNFLGGGGPSMGGVWIFSGTPHSGSVPDNFQSKGVSEL